MKKNLVYCLAPSRHPLLTERLQVLNQYQFDVCEFLSLDQLLAEYDKARASIILISDDPSNSEFIPSWINQITSTPKLRGVKLILTTLSRQTDIQLQAYRLDFKDIIPTDLPIARWIQRFSFSALARPQKLAKTIGQLTVNESATVSIPIRIVWMTNKQMRIEARITAERNDTLTLVGPLAEALGVRSLPLQVQQPLKTNLLYRFSNGYICHYQTPDSAALRLSQLLDQLSASRTNARCRVFIVAKSQTIRSSIIEQLAPSRFELLTAINQRSIVDEPKFFNPHIIFVESELCKAAHLTLVKKMIEGLSSPPPLVIVGSSASEEVEVLRKFIPSKLFQISALPENLDQEIMATYLKGFVFSLPDAPATSILLSSEVPYSMADLVVPAKIKSLHPETTSLLLQSAVGNYGICKIDSALFSKMTVGPVFGKITSAYPDVTQPDTEKMRYRANITLGIQAKNMELISDYMLATLQGHFGLFDKVPLSPARTIAKAPQPVPLEERSKTAVKEPSALVSIAPAAATVTEKIDLSPKLSPEEVEKLKIRRLKANLKLALNIVMMVGASILVIYLTASLLEYAAANWQRSGGNYSNQLKSFKTKGGAK
jgi:hypothetical protein